MSAPLKECLLYYTWDCNAFDVDKKLKKLSRKYGPLGETIYRRMLDLVYSNSYYLKADIEDAAMMVSDKIGSKWVSDSKCAEVLEYCSDIGLFEKSLVKSNVWTSVGIQNRYFHVMRTMRRKIDMNNKKYLLTDILLNAPSPNDSSEETPVPSEETPVPSEETPVNYVEIKEDKTKEKEDIIYSLFDLFENSFARPLTQIETKIVFDQLEFHSPEMIQHALTLAVANNAINMKYVLAILNNWRTNNIKTIEQTKPRQRRTQKVQRSAPLPTYSQESSEQLSDEELQRMMQALNRLEE